MPANRAGERDPQIVSWIDDRSLGGAGGRAKGPSLEEANSIERLARTGEMHDLVEPGVQEAGAYRDPQHGQSLAQVASGIHESTFFSFGAPRPHVGASLAPISSAINVGGGGPRSPCHAALLPGTRGPSGRDFRRDGPAGGRVGPDHRDQLRAAARRVGLS
jgi:hypothetical protein